MSLSVDLLSNPVTTSSYLDVNQILGKNNSCLFYGFIVKNEYDEKRFNICNHLNPVRIKYSFNYLNENVEHFLYGVILPGNEMFKKLSLSLELASIDPKKYLTLESYKRIFSEYNIETNNSFLNYSIGLYPFDNIKCLHDGMVDRDLFFIDNSIPFYQKIANINPFIICRTKK